MAALIALLIYQTQWLLLRPGLTILLAGQVGAVLVLCIKNTKLLRDLDCGKARASEAPDFLAWFDEEETFVRRLAFFQNGCQMIGFVALGYEFWVSTRNLWLAITIGCVYPATVYWGATRRSNLKTIRRLRKQKKEIEVQHPLP
ncbi:MAG: hypothetical protein M3Y57_07915 [Acidobacteriota bacterium]|nr:hypothetical protein [Acidobacteriota bacterium]